MTFNPDNKETYFRLDDCWMVLEGDDPDSWKDSIGRNLDAYVAWGDIRLVNAVSDCFHGGNFGRHPRRPGNVSRDHLSYALILFAISNKWIYFGELAYRIKWRTGGQSMRGMYLWVKSWYSAHQRWLFYLCKIPEMLIQRFLNWAIRKIAKIKPERSQDDWDMSITDNRTKLQRRIKMPFPAYALHNFAWQLFIMDDCFGKRLLQRIALPMAGRHNYVIRHLLGDKKMYDRININKYKNTINIELYKSMTGSRWTTTLDELNDRNVIIRESEENDLDRDYLLGVLNL